MSRARGFTIVELIAVMMLLGILSVVAISRTVKPSAYAPGIVAQTVAAEVQLATQRAASRSDASVTLSVDRLGADWRFVLSTDVEGVVRTELVNQANTVLWAQSGAAAANLDTGTALELQFDAAGNLASVVIGGAAGDPSMGVAVQVTGDSLRAVCVYPTGYATTETCA